jgi:hypothetical protein
MALTPVSSEASHQARDVPPSRPSRFSVALAVTDFVLVPQQGTPFAEDQLTALPIDPSVVGSCTVLDLTPR